MNYKTFDENITGGFIVCKRDNECVIKHCNDDRFITREYELV